MKSKLRICVSMAFMLIFSGLHAQYNGGNGRGDISLMAGNIYLFNIIYVKHDASGSNNGTSWTDAYTSFQSALDAAEAGDQIWVARGTYKPSYDYGLNIAAPNTARGYHFRMINGVEIYGGFAGTELTVAQRTGYGLGGINQTILSADINGNDINTGYSWSNLSDNCFHVFFHPAGYNLNASAIIDGFIIQGGRADLGSGGHWIAGGMYNEGSSPTLRNLVFRYNSAYNGGAMYITGASPVGDNLVFIDNISVSTGGAIHIQGVSYPVFTNCLIARNMVTDGDVSSGGGGIINYSTGLSTFINTTLVSNVAGNRGGGIYNSGNVNFRNSILWGNQANASSDPARQIFNYSGLTNLENSCVSNGAGDLLQSSGSIILDINTITTDPLFADAPNGDFRLYSTSPCADAGNDSYNALLTDIRGDGFGRKLLKTDYTQKGTIDMGAYEYNSNTDPIGCANPASGGTIAGVQTLCYGEDPVAFTSSNLPAGYNGNLEYMWQSSITGSSSGFVDISGSNSEVYDAPAVTQTTWFKRLARVDCEADWSGAAPSNVLVVTVTPLPAFSYTKTDNTCFNGGDGTITINASGGYGSGYEYSIDNGQNWQSGNQFTGLSSAYYTLMVKDSNGCVQTNCVP